MRYRIAGTELVCGHCGGNDFRAGKAQLNTALMTFLDLDWLNRTAMTFLCTRCGRIEWFLTAADEFPDDMTEEVECPACGGTIPAGSDRCTSCGWSYRDKQ